MLYVIISCFILVGFQYYTMNFNQPTIITKDPYYQDKIGNSKALSFSDISIANKLYKCDGNMGLKNTCHQMKRNY